MGGFHDIVIASNKVDNTAAVEYMQSDEYRRLMKIKW